MVEASGAQAAAGTALCEAADALAAEEEALAASLGLGSVTELEAAVDAMDGIRADGAAVDVSDAREARVRGGGDGAGERDLLAVRGGGAEGEAKGTAAQPTKKRAGGFSFFGGWAVPPTAERADE